MRQVPYYFWDFAEDSSAVLVQSDSDAYPVLARYRIENNAPRQIERAEALIADLTAGRLTPKQALLRHGA